MTHFADADADRRARHRASSWRAFEAATRDLPGERSLATAPRPCATARAWRRGGDWVRAGHPALRHRRPTSRCTTSPHWDLRPTMTLRTRLIAMQDLARRRQRRLRQQLHAPTRRCASASSPAATPTATRASRRDTGTPVLVDGVRTRTVGRVSMDMITVDLTPVPRRASAARSRCGAVGRERRGAADRRGRARGRHDRLRADVRAGAARAGADARRDRHADGCATPRRDRRRSTSPRSSSPPSARRAPAGRTSTRCRARCTCASTSRASSLPEAIKERLLARATSASPRGRVVIKAQAIAARTNRATRWRDGGWSPRLHRTRSAASRAAQADVRRSAPAQVGRRRAGRAALDVAAAPTRRLPRRGHGPAALRGRARRERA